MTTAFEDAGTAYDPKAVAVVSGTEIKSRGGPANEATKREAISHAAGSRSRPPRARSRLRRWMESHATLEPHPTVSLAEDRQSTLGVEHQRDEYCAFASGHIRVVFGASEDFCRCACWRYCDAICAAHSRSAEIASLMAASGVAPPPWHPGNRECARHARRQGPMARTTMITPGCALAAHDRVVGGLLL